MHALCPATPRVRSPFAVRPQPIRTEIALSVPAPSLVPDADEYAYGCLEAVWDGTLKGMEQIMENVHGTTEMSPPLASDLGRGPVLALALAGTLAVGWVVAMLYVIASWVTG